MEIHKSIPLECLCIGSSIQLNTHVIANCDLSYWFIDVLWTIFSIEIMWLKDVYHSYCCHRYHSLTSSLSIADNLNNKTVIEYPSIHVVLPGHTGNYQLLDQGECAGYWCNRCDWSSFFFFINISLTIVSIFCKNWSSTSSCFISLYMNIVLSGKKNIIYFIWWETVYDRLSKC